MIRALSNLLSGLGGEPTCQPGNVHRAVGERPSGSRARGNASRRTARQAPASGNTHLGTSVSHTVGAAMLRRAGLVGAGLILGAGLISTPVLAQQPIESSGKKGLVHASDAPDLFLMYTGDVIGYIDTCGCKRNPAGGLARRSWVFERVDELFPRVPRLVVDSGNFSDHPTAEGDLKTAALVEGMNRLGYQAVNVGERDLRTGYADLMERTKDRKFDLISANIIREDTEKPVFEPHAVIDLKDASGKTLKVGVVGVARHNPVFLKAGPEDSNLVTVRPLDPVKREVAALKSKNVDMIVLLAAVHKDDAAEILREVPEIRFVLGAYGGVFTTREEKEGNGWILYSGNQGKRVGETRVYFDEEGGIERQTSTLHFLTRLYPADQEMLDFVNSVPVSKPSAPKSPPAAE